TVQILPAQMCSTHWNDGDTVRLWTKLFDWYASHGQKSFSPGCRTMLSAKIMRTIRRQECSPLRLSILLPTHWHFQNKSKRHAIALTSITTAKGCAPGSRKKSITSLTRLILSS